MAHLKNRDVRKAVKDGYDKLQKALHSADAGDHSCTHMYDWELNEYIAVLQSLRTIEQAAAWDAASREQRDAWRK